MKAFLLFLAAIGSGGALLAQKIRSETVSYFYTKLPRSPLPPAIRSCTVVVEAPYVANNQRLKAAYEEGLATVKALHEKELAAFPSRVKAAEDQYYKELEEYEKKSLAEKFAEKQVLGENTRPVKPTLFPPVLQLPPSPVLQTEYDLRALSATALQWEGYRRDTAGYRVVVTLYGFDATEPVVQSAQKDMVSLSKGSTSTYKATYYHVESYYRHPMALTLFGRDGKEIFRIVPSELNNFKTFKTPATDSYPSFNRQGFLKSTEAQLLTDNLELLERLLNDRCGFAKTEQPVTLYYVKEKGDAYADLTQAYNEAASGLRLLYEDSAAGTRSLHKAIALWNGALATSDPADKKARIDRAVTIALYFNLLNAHIALGEGTTATALLSKLNALSLSGDDRKEKVAIEKRLADWNNRKQNH